MAAGDSAGGGAPDGGGSSELVVYGARGLGFRRDLHLRHRDDAANLSRLPRDDGGRRWRLVTARPFGRSSTAVGAASGNAPAPRRQRGASQGGSSTSSQPPIVASGGGKWRATAAARVLGLVILWEKIQLI
jgi:hypothetical protein